MGKSTIYEAVCCNRENNTRRGQLHQEECNLGDLKTRFICR